MMLLPAPSFLKSGGQAGLPAPRIESWRWTDAVSLGQIVVVWTRAGRPSSPTPEQPDEATYQMRFAPTRAELESARIQEDSSEPKLLEGALLALIQMAKSRASIFVHGAGGTLYIQVRYRIGEEVSPWATVEVTRGGSSD